MNRQNPYWRQKNLNNILSKLEFKPENKNNKIRCQVPEHRSDVSIKEDIAEEVARIWGYNKFPTTLPTGIQSREKICMGKRERIGFSFGRKGRRGVYRKVGPE